MSDMDLIKDAVIDYDPSSILEEIAKNIARKYDEAVFHAFEQYGYDKDWLLKPENMKRVHIESKAARGGIGFPNFSTYSVDGVDLFMIITRQTIDSWTCNIRYIAPLEEKEDVE